MTYTNDLPSGATFALVEPTLQAVIYSDATDTGSALLDQDIEITLPYKVRPEFGFAGMTVPFRALLQFLTDNGAPLSRDRDLTLRHQARDEKMAEEGVRYDRLMSPDLPPQALDELGTDGFAFDTNYVMNLVANDVADYDPDEAARLRHIAETYYPDREFLEPTEEQLAQALGAVEQMIAAHQEIAESGGDAPLICRVGLK